MMMAYELARPPPIDGVLFLLAGYSLPSNIQGRTDALVLNAPFSAPTPTGPTLFRRALT